MNAPKHSVDKLKQNVWLKGDVPSYQELELNALDESPDKFLFWAMYMANKYDYVNAYWDVYFSLEETYANKSGDSALFKMDDKTRKIALEYLKQAADKNDSSAIRTLKEMKRKQFPASWFK